MHAGGDEWFVIAGDLTVERGGPTRLTANGYACDPDITIDSGAAGFSNSGCLAIRWTRADHLRLPPLRY